MPILRARKPSSQSVKDAAEKSAAAQKEDNRLGVVQSPSDHTLRIRVRMFGMFNMAGDFMSVSGIYMRPVIERF